MYSHQYSDGEA